MHFAGSYSYKKAVVFKLRYIASYLLEPIVKVLYLTAAKNMGRNNTPFAFIASIYVGSFMEVVIFHLSMYRLHPSSLVKTV
jgi:hypothetical protein